ncbi:MAG: Imm21 family immunity protein [bacterium]
MRSETPSLQWLDTGVPGPNVLLPVSLLRDWSGSLPPKDGRAIQATFRWQGAGDATDYDRACDVNDAAAILAVGAGQAIALYAEGAMPIAWKPTTTGGMLLAQLYTSERRGLPKELPMVPPHLTWESVGEFTTDGAVLRLCHAAEAGDAKAALSTLDVQLAAGRYQVESATLHDPQMELWLVRLEPI